MPSSDYLDGRSGYVSVPDGQLYYEVAGSGKGLVLLHSAISDSRVWDYEFSQFNSNRTVIRYDVRGFGKSSTATKPYSDSKDLKILLDSLGITEISIIAVSNSGRIALDFALEYPEQVDNIVLVGSGLGLFEPQGNSEAEKWGIDLESRFSEIASAYERGRKNEAIDKLVRLFAHQVKGKDIDLVRDLIGHNLDEIITDRSASNSRFDVEETALSRIKPPALVIAGEKDHPIINWSSRKLVESLPESNYMMISDGDHFINLSSRDEFIRAVSDFLGL